MGLRLAIAALCLAIELPTQAGRAAVPEVCQIHIILFVPADVSPPEDYQQRIDDLVDYSDAFFGRGLARWGHKHFVSPFRRTRDGRAAVRVFRGKDKAATYKAVPLRAEIMDALRGQGEIDRSARQVWWILVYAGEPPARFQGFLGGMGEDIGGWATCNLDMTPGRIDPREPMGSDFLASLMLKGMLHELGHGLGLPHIGPLDRDKAGNTLMGPTHLNWRRVTGGREKRVYLSEAEAAILARHPAFRGVVDDRGKLPALQVEDLGCNPDPRTGHLLVSGRVRSNERAVYALVADESEDRPGEYWTKTYAGPVAQDGSFEVAVTEPVHAGGTLRTWFVFEDGDHTGDGRGRSRPSGVGITYAHENGRWTFEPERASTQRND